MLDVHPPHHTPNTWRDFFIHIATIVCGLIIAVGLEQTVEAIHRSHQRHLLEHELRAEAEILQRNAEIDIDQYDAQLKFLLAQRKDVNLRLESHGKAELPSRTYVAPPHGHGLTGTGTMALLNPIWDSARADGRLALLPEGLKRTYGLVSYRKIAFDALADQVLAAREAAGSYLFQFSDIRTPRTPDFSRMSEAQLSEFRALNTTAFEKLRTLRNETVDLSGELNLVLGEELIDQQALTPADRKVLKEARDAHREDFARLADEIDAEDTARDKAIPKPIK